MKKENNVSVRLDSRDLMLLNELKEITGTNRSVLVRSMIKNNIDNLIDENGNFKIRREEKKE